MADHEQIAMQDAHTSLIAVETYGDDQIHLIDFLRSVSEAATSSEDFLRRLREVCLMNAIAKKNMTNNPTISLAIRQLLTANGVPVHLATGFSIIRGKLDAILEDNLELLQEAIPDLEGTLH
jgi:hypothetical protein